jgi:hypothetical protein
MFENLAVLWFNIFKLAAIDAVLPFSSKEAQIYKK